MPNFIFPNSIKSPILSYLNTIDKNELFKDFSGITTGKCQPRTQLAVCVYFSSTYLNINDGDGGLGLVEVPSHSVHCLRDIVQHKIQIHLIFLGKRTKRSWTVNNRKVNVSFCKAHLLHSLQSVVPGKFTKSTRKQPTF